jgi:hypothetical protein
MRLVVSEYLLYHTFMRLYRSRNLYDFRYKTVLNTIPTQLRNSVFVKMVKLQNLGNIW